MKVMKEIFCIYLSWWIIFEDRVRISISCHGVQRSTLACVIRETCWFWKRTNVTKNLSVTCFCFPACHRFDVCWWMLYPQPYIVWTHAIVHHGLHSQLPQFSLVTTLHSHVNALCVQAIYDITCQKAKATIHFPDHPRREPTGTALISDCPILYCLEY